MPGKKEMIPCNSSQNEQGIWSESLRTKHLACDTLVGSDCRSHQATFVETCFRNMHPDGSYKYEEFLEAFEQLHYSLATNEEIKMCPERKWFDAKLALKNCPRYFQQFSSQTLDAVFQAQSMVNRWNFMKLVMTSGEEWMTSSLAFTLLVLATCHDHMDLKMTNLRMLDAGCGTGFIVSAWAIMAGSDAEIWGLEFAPEVVKAATKEIFETRDSFAYPESCSKRDELRRKIVLAVGDIAQMEYKSTNENGMEVVHSFPPNYFDVINVGVAMSESDRVTECLKEGGLLILPNVKSQVKVPSSDDCYRVPAQFKVFKKVKAALKSISQFGGQDEYPIELKFIPIVVSDNSEADQFIHH